MERQGKYPCTFKFLTTFTITYTTDIGIPLGDFLLGMRRVMKDDVIQRVPRIEQRLAGVNGL